MTISQDLAMPPSVGVSFIDEEHGLLIGMLEQLRLDGVATRIDTAKTEIEELGKYIRKHFDFEEDVLFKLDRNEYLRHVKAHKSLLVRFYEMCADIESKDFTIPYRLATMLEEWLHEHIADYDLTLASLMKARPTT